MMAEPNVARAAPDRVFGNSLEAIGRTRITRYAGCCGGLFARQQRTKSWTTGLVSLAGVQATPTWLALTPVTGR